VVDGVATVGQPKRGEPVGAEHEHGDAERLEPLQRRRDVEDRLDTRGHDRDRAGAEDREVGRLVERLPRVAVDAANAAGREHADPRLCGEP
jgi:hypothetical protein